MALLRNLTGLRFGQWEVEARANSSMGCKRVRRRCKCDCGTVADIGSDSLLSGKSKSCGCGHIRSAPGETGLTRLFYEYKRGAAQRNLVFLLSMEQVRMVTSSPCRYCGATPSYSKTVHSASAKARSHGRYVYNGLDRVDNTRGYEYDNVAPCCGICNSAKSDKTVEEFRAWVKRVHSFWASKTEVI